MDMTAVGRKICDLRKSRDMTQIALAEAVGVSYQAVSSWERGLTMPDISKLPDIARLFSISIDELIGDSTQSCLIRKAMTNEVTKEFLQQNDISTDQIISVAPVLKPNQVDKAAKEIIQIEIHELEDIAPFISREVMDELALRAANIGRLSDLEDIAPFISQEVMNELALRAADKGRLSNLEDIAPFISREVMDELALRAADKGRLSDLEDIAPFISQEVMNELALRAADKGSLSDLEDIAPFISRETMNQLARKLIKEGRTRELKEITPFIDHNVLS